MQTNTIQETDKQLERDSQEISSARTDPEIAREAVHAMKIHITVPDKKIKALVNEGFVTLKGTVDWGFQRRCAESCVRNVGGVRGVVNHLKVIPRVSSWPEREEAELAAWSAPGVAEVIGHISIVP